MSDIKQLATALVALNVPPGYNRFNPNASKIKIYLIRGAWYSAVLFLGLYSGEPTILRICALAVGIDFVRYLTIVKWQEKRAWEAYFAEETQGGVHDKKLQSVMREYEKNPNMENQQKLKKLMKGEK
ncbi:MAG: hypothetical protein QG632_494 [Candidatus Dependentiae bacterium]|nr:hypothetical protein [Candidatus Dependentiae bacterium]